jgi:hypothetical protein
VYFETPRRDRATMRLPEHFVGCPRTGSVQGLVFERLVENTQKSFSARDSDLGGYTSIREPMITVLSRGRPKCSAASAVTWDVAMNRYLRHGDIVGAAPTTSSMLDRK